MSKAATQFRASELPLPDRLHQFTVHEAAAPVDPQRLLTGGVECSLRAPKPPAPVDAGLHSPRISGARP